MRENNQLTISRQLLWVLNSFQPQPMSMTDQHRKRTLMLTLMWVYRIFQLHFCDLARSPIGALMISSVARVWSIHQHVVTCNSITRECVTFQASSQGSRAQVVLDMCNLVAQVPVLGMILCLSWHVNVNKNNRYTIRATCVVTELLVWLPQSILQRLTCPLVFLSDPPSNKLLHTQTLDVALRPSLFPRFPRLLLLACIEIKIWHQNVDDCLPQMTCSSQESVHIVIQSGWIVLTMQKSEICLQTNFRRRLC